MTKATHACDLTEINACTITIPGVLVANQQSGGRRTTSGVIKLNNLPEISDNKSVAYNDEAIIGRSTPLKTYSHSENRVISMKLHFFITKKGDGDTNLRYLRWIQSAAYPQDTLSRAPYKPPVVCKIQCGDLLAKSVPLCVVLISYNVTFPTDVAWDIVTNCPYKFDVDCQWQAVYAVDDLPYNTDIIESGR